MVRAPSRASRSCCRGEQILLDEELADPLVHPSLRALDPRPGRGAQSAPARTNPPANPGISGWRIGASASDLYGPRGVPRVASRPDRGRAAACAARAAPARPSAGSREPEDRVQQRAGRDGGFRRESEALQHQPASGVVDAEEARRRGQRHGERERRQRHPAGRQRVQAGREGEAERPEARQDRDGRGHAARWSASGSRSRRGAGRRAARRDPRPRGRAAAERELRRARRAAGAAARRPRAAPAAARAAAQASASTGSERQRQRARSARAARCRSASPASQSAPIARQSTTKLSITRSITTVPITAAGATRHSRASTSERITSPMRSGSTLLARKPIAVARKSASARQRPDRVGEVAPAQRRAARSPRRRPAATAAEQHATGPRAGTRAPRRARSTPRSANAIARA